MLKNVFVPLNQVVVIMTENQFQRIFYCFASIDINIIMHLLSENK